MDITKEEFENYERQIGGASIGPMGNLTSEKIIEISKNFNFWKQIHKGGKNE